MTKTLEKCYLSSHENYNQIYYLKFQKFNYTLTCIKTRAQIQQFKEDMVRKKKDINMSWQTSNKSKKKIAKGRPHWKQHKE